jgi:hypothetical protein
MRIGVIVVILIFDVALKLDILETRLWVKILFTSRVDSIPFYFLLIHGENIYKGKNFVIFINIFRLHSVDSFQTGTTPLYRLIVTNLIIKLLDLLLHFLLFHFKVTFFGLPLFDQIMSFFHNQVQLFFEDLIVLFFAMCLDL